MIGRLASAFAFGTVIPASRRAADFGPATVSCLPAAGAALGVVAAGVLWAGRWAFGPHSLLAGLMAVVALLILTRGLHVDGPVPHHRQRPIRRAVTAQPVDCVGETVDMQAAGQNQ